MIFYIVFIITKTHIYEHMMFYIAMQTMFYKFQKKHQIERINKVFKKDFLFSPWCAPNFIPQPTISKRIHFQHISHSEMLETGGTFVGVISKTNYFWSGGSIEMPRVCNRGRHLWCGIDTRSVKYRIGVVLLLKRQSHFTPRKRHNITFTLLLVLLFVCLRDQFVQHCKEQQC